MKEILPIGTTGVAARDLECANCTIKKGTRITITGWEYMYGYDVVDEFGNEVIEAGFNCIIPDGAKEKEEEEEKPAPPKKERKQITILPVGTKGVAAYDIECANCTIKKGTRITITGWEYMYGYDVVDEFGNKIIEAGFDCIIPDERKKDGHEPDDDDDGER